jgi:hypothetical protein
MEFSRKCRETPFLRMKCKSSESKGEKKNTPKNPESVKLRNISEYVRINAEHLNDDLKQI